MASNYPDEKVPNRSEDYEEDDPFVLPTEDEDAWKKKKGKDSQTQVGASANAKDFAPPSYQQVIKSPPPRPPLPSAKKVASSSDAVNVSSPKGSSSASTSSQAEEEGQPRAPPRSQSRKDQGTQMLPPVVGAVLVMPTANEAADNAANVDRSQQQQQQQRQQQEPSQQPLQQPQPPISQTEAKQEVPPQPVMRQSASGQNIAPTHETNGARPRSIATVPTAEGQGGNTTIVIPQGTSVTMTVGPGQAQSPAQRQPAPPVPQAQQAPPKEIFPLTFVDFTNGPVSNQLHNANLWLKEHREYKVVNIETVEIPRENHGNRFGDSFNINDTLAFSLRLANNIQFIRFLRLWVVPRQPHMMLEDPQQIGFKDAVPLSKKTNKFKFENLPEAVSNFNDRLKKIPLPGKILNVQALHMMFKDKTLPNFEKFDENYFTWIREGDDSPEYHDLTYLRVYYEVGPTVPSVIIQIGFEDFIPKQKDDAKSHRDFEPFQKSAQRAQNWINENPTKVVLSAQTIEYNFTKSPGSKFEAKTEKSMLKDADTGDLRHLKYLRIFYQTYLQKDASFYPEYYPITLTYKTFRPEVLARETKNTAPVFESLHQTWRRMTAWVKLTQVKVISVETVPIKVYPGSKCVYGDHEVTYLGHRSDWAEFWLYVIRVYINGVYVEPPAQLLPPLPVLPTGDDKSKCTIS